MPALIGRTWWRAEPLRAGRSRSYSKRRWTRQGEPIIFGVLAIASLGIQSEVGRYFKTLGEPHSADPLAMWCGEGERKTPPYPIGQSLWKLIILWASRWLTPLVSILFCDYLILLRWLLVLFFPGDRRFFPPSTPISVMLKRMESISEVNRLKSLATSSLLVPSSLNALKIIGNNFEVSLCLIGLGSFFRPHFLDNSIIRLR